MRKIIAGIAILFSILTLFNELQAQNPFYFETELISKFSIGTPSRNIIEYAPGVEIDVPKVEMFRNPVYGIDFSLNYRLKDEFAVGLAIGINVAKYEEHPIEYNEYYDKVMIPLYLRAIYQYQVKQNWILISNIMLGYQFSDYKYLNSNEGFFFLDRGGLITGIKVGAGTQVFKVNTQIKVGYEFCQFSHEYSVSGFGFTDLSYDDKINFKTYNHLLTLTIVIAF